MKKPTRKKGTSQPTSSNSKAINGKSKDAPVTPTLTAPPVVNFKPNPEGLLPPLPNPIPPLPPAPTQLQPPLQPIPQPFPQPITFPTIRSLKEGCYLIRYTPKATGTVFIFTHYDGTMRIERDGSNTIASGDIRAQRSPFPTLPLQPPGPGPIPPSPVRFLPLEPNPANGIPIFPRDRYRYYLRVTQILESFILGNSFTLGFDRWKFDHTTKTWTNEGPFTAVMSWTPAPASYPSTSNYLTGDVKDSTNAVVGTLTMGWVSNYFRRVVIEVDRVSQSESPVDNGAGVTWKTVFDQVGWDVTLDHPSNVNVPEPSGEFWSDAECHAALLAGRDASDLDAEWRYHVLCIRRHDNPLAARGVMYDNGSSDSNNVPREGCAVCSHWVVPNEPMWGLVQGMRFGTATGPYFRTALHEVGHAMGLYHNTFDTGIMNTTDTIAASAIPPVQFPNNIQWSHAPDDQKRLRHMPDQYVRPGGTPFGTSYSSVPISPDDTAEVPGLDLRVTPLLETTPLGAAVRVNVELVHNTGYAFPAPSSISLKSEFVSGTVVDPSGATRSFSPLIMCADGHEMASLQAGQSVRDSLTLLRGGQGALFPMPGVHYITVCAAWEVNGIRVGVSGSANVMVTPLVDNSHAAAALKVLTTPDTLLTLVLGGDHLDDGIDAIQAALKDETLRPHYAYLPELPKR